MRFSGHVQMGGDPGEDSELSGGIACIIWLGNASGSPRRSWRTLLGWRSSRISCLSSCYCDRTTDKEKKLDLTEWMDGKMANWWGYWGWRWMILSSKQLIDPAKTESHAPLCTKCVVHRSLYAWCIIEILIKSTIHPLPLIHVKVATHKYLLNHLD